MLATKPMSIQASRHHLRQQRAVIVETPEQRRARKAAKTKLTPQLAWDLFVKLAPKLLIAAGVGFIFFGILLICMGYTSSKHYPEGRGIGITLLILGLGGLAGGIAWRVRRTRYRAEKAKRGDTASTTTTRPKEQPPDYASSVSVADVRMTEIGEFDDISGGARGRGARPKTKVNSRNTLGPALPPVIETPVTPILNNKRQPDSDKNIPQIQVSYIDCDRDKNNSFEYM